MIILLESIHPDAVAVLEAVDEVKLMADPAQVDEDVDRSAVVAILTRGRGRISGDTFTEFPSLVAVSRCGAGLDNIDTRAAAAAGVRVVHAPGSTTATVAETAVMLMLVLARRLVTLDNAVQRGDWAIRNTYQGVELRGKRLGVVGLGAIGSRVAELGLAFGMDVVGATRSGNGPVRVVSLDELFSTSDMVELCVALTADTEGLVSEDRLASMKPGALLINTARGVLVDHAALADALAEDRLGGYAADVWTPEPPPRDDPVLATGKAIVTPHVAGLTDVTYREICMRPATSIAAILTGGVPDPTTIFTG